MIVSDPFKKINDFSFQSIPTIVHNVDAKPKPYVA